MRTAQKVFEELIAALYEKNIAKLMVIFQELLPDYDILITRKKK